MMVSNQFIELKVSTLNECLYFINAGEVL